MGDIPYNETHDPLGSRAKGLRLKFARFWCRVSNETGLVVARGWSQTSQDEARDNAQLRLKRILDHLRRGQPLDEYQYVVDNVICEEVIDRLWDENVEVAIISRNSYGALVMNTTRLMFVDVDLDQPTLGARLKAWFSRSPETLSPEQRTLDELRQWQQANSQYSLRVYRTRAGFRVLVSNRCFDAVDDEAMRVLEGLRCDLLYRKLCVSQACFRARLSPKPWRIGAGRPPAHFPYQDDQAKRDFQNWFDGYVRLAGAFSVCRYVETLGSELAPVGVATLIDQHDALCCGDRPLA